MTAAPASPDPIDILVGARIRLRRKMQGLSQTALADAVGVTFQQVQKYERGANRVSASRLSQIAKKLGCSVAHLHGEEATVANGAELTSLSVSGAAELLELYAGLKPGLRRAILDLVRAQVIG